LTHHHSKRAVERRPASRAPKLVAAAVLAALSAGCATDPHTGQPSFKETFASDDPCSNNARNIGIGVGALAGAMLGNQFKHSNQSRLIGAMVGATAGGLIGNDMDQRRCALAKIARQYKLDMKVSTVSASGEVIEEADLHGNRDAAQIRKNSVGSVVEVRDQGGAGGHFESNSDQLTPKAREYFGAIADAYNARTTANEIKDPVARMEYVSSISKRKILLVGHTDDTGNSKLNADLSERRAKAVSNFMQARGIARDSLYFQGAGESYPVADNGSAEGRAENRRVEIVEIADQANFDKYLAARTPRYDFYRAKAGDAPGRTAEAPHARAEAIAARAATPAKTKISGAAALAGRKNPASGSRPGATLASVAPVTPAVATGAAKPIDFGGVPMAQSSALADVGRVEPKRAYFSLISSAYASEPAVISDCSQDRPRVSNGVKALADGKVYKTSEHLPGLYGKTWTDQVNGHQVVINKVAVLSSDGSLANLPEFKVYANYNPTKNPNPIADLNVSPEVNTYLGSKGVLYRMFLNGRAGLECVDVIFANEGGTAAKGGRLVYTHAARPYVAEFKPRIYQ
jgi:outer membrane protein OmpA-like peptidoglycan-associated protein